MRFFVNWKVSSWILSFVGWIISVSWLTSTSKRKQKLWRKNPFLNRVRTTTTATPPRQKNTLSVGWFHSITNRLKSICQFFGKLKHTPHSRLHYNIIVYTQTRETPQFLLLFLHFKRYSSVVFPIFHLEFLIRLLIFVYFWDIVFNKTNVSVSSFVAAVSLCSACCFSSSFLHSAQYCNRSKN